MMGRVERERERKKHGCEREKSICCQLNVPGQVIKPASQGHFSLEREREREREREIDFLPYTPQLRSNPQPTYVPRLGIKPVTLWFIG